MFVRIATLASVVFFPAQGEWIAWQTQEPEDIARAYMANLLPAFKHLDVAVLESLYTTDCVFGSRDLSRSHGVSISQQKETLMTGIKSVGLEHDSKEFREKIVAMKILSAVKVKADDWESDLTGSNHAIRVTAWVAIEVDGEEPFYHWVVLVPFEGAKNGWTCQTVLMSPGPTSATTELLEQPAEAARDASLETSSRSALVSSGGDAVKIAEAFAAEFVPAFKDLDLSKLDRFYTPECVFGNPEAGKDAQQKEVLMTGMKSLTWTKDIADDVKGMKVISAVSGQGESRIIALVEVEGEKGSAYYQWVVLVPFKGAWTCQTVLASPKPVSHTAELLEQPVQAVGDASVSAAALPGALPASLGPVAIFASGVLLSGCIFSRKALLAKLSPSALQEPLLL
jgi:ketosteroid isomerase-like protein